MANNWIVADNRCFTEKMQMTNIIGNFVFVNNVFGREVLAHHPEEILEFTDFH